MLSSVEGFKSVVLDQLAEGVIVADADGRIISVNRAAEELHGQARLDVLPDGYSESYALLTMQDLPYPPDDLPLARAVLKGESVVDVPWKIRRPDGSVIIAVGTARPVRNAAGDQIGSVLTMRDDTLRVRAEQELLEAVRIKDALLFEVNHRVRNSLQIVSSILALPLKRVQDDLARETLALTQQRIEVISTIHRSLYELGKHDEVDCIALLPELCKDVIETYSVQEAICFICETRGELVLPVSKATSVCLAMTELITNACKHAYQGRSRGVVRLLLDGGTDQVLIRVDDDGVGIRTVSGKSEHRGIGMILVDSLAKSLAADIRIDSGRLGTCFTIAFTKPEPVPDLSNALVTNRHNKDV